MPAKRIAIELDTDDQLSYIPQVQGMVQKSGFTSEILSSEQIINGELFGFDAVIFPGGMGAFYGLYGRLRRRLCRWIENDGNPV
ncbi:hypothetical protein ES703_40418 [subsurface metagenome]